MNKKITMILIVIINLSIFGCKNTEIKISPLNSLPKIGTYKIVINRKGSSKTIKNKDNINTIISLTSNIPLGEYEQPQSLENPIKIIMCNDNHRTVIYSIHNYQWIDTKNDLSRKVDPDKAKNLERIIDKMQDETEKSDGIVLIPQVYPDGYKTEAGDIKEEEIRKLHKDMTYREMMNKLGKGSYTTHDLDPNKNYSCYIECDGAGSCNVTFQFVNPDDEIELDGAEIIRCINNGQRFFLSSKADRRTLSEMSLDGELIVYNLTSDDGKYAYKIYDRKDNLVLPGEYSWVGIYDNDCIVVSKADKVNEYALYNSDGDMLLGFDYKHIHFFGDKSATGIAKSAETHKEYLINTKGEKISDTEYDFLYFDYKDKGILKANIGDKQMIIDYSGKVLLSSENFQNGRIWNRLVQIKDGKYIYYYFKNKNISEKFEQLIKSMEIDKYINKDKGDGLSIYLGRYYTYLYGTDTIISKKNNIYNIAIEYPELLSRKWTTDFNAEAKIAAWLEDNKEYIDTIADY